MQQFQQPVFGQQGFSQQPPEQLQSYQYKRMLRKTVNGLGALLLVFFAIELVIIIALDIILTAVGVEDELQKMDVLYMLESSLVSSLVFFVTALVYCLIRRQSFGSLFPFSKTGPRMLYRLCAIGIAFSLMSNYVVDLLDNNLGLFGIENSGGYFETANNPNVLMYFIAVAIIPAFVEEFAFRGVIMGALRPYSEALAILVSSAVFALMHGNFVQLPFTFCCGLVFAYIDIKANSMLPSIIVHFLNNGFSVMSDILVSYKVCSETTVNLCYGVIFVVSGILAFFAIRRIVKEKDSRYFNLKGGNDFLPFKQKMKTACSSPPLIVFTAVMLASCLYEMISGMS